MKSLKNHLNLQRFLSSQLSNVLVVGSEFAIARYDRVLDFVSALQTVEWLRILAVQLKLGRIMEDAKFYKIRAVHYLVAEYLSKNRNW